MSGKNWGLIQFVGGLARRCSIHCLLVGLMLVAIAQDGLNGLWLEPT